MPKEELDTEFDTAQCMDCGKFYRNDRTEGIVGKPLTRAYPVPSPYKGKYGTTGLCKSCGKKRTIGHWYWRQIARD